MTNAVSTYSTGDTKATTLVKINNQDFSAMRLMQKQNLIGDVPRLRKAIRDRFVSTSVRHVRIAKWGDSVGNDYFNDRAEAAVYRELGWGGRWLRAATSNSTWYLSTLTGAVANTGDFDICSYGLTITLASSATWEVQITNVNTGMENSIRTADMLVDTAVICYARESGAGTFKISTSDGTKELTYTDVQVGIDASNGSLAFGTATVAVPRTDQSKIRLTHTAGGSIRIIGILVTDSTSSGAIIMPLTQGGINVGQAANAGNAAVYNGLMAVLKPHVMLWSAKDDLNMLDGTHPSYGGNGLASFVSKMQAGYPYFDWAFILPSPTDSFAAFLALEDLYVDYVLQYAIAGNHAVWDFRTLIRAWTQNALEYSPPIAITLSRSTTTATATFGAGHGYESGDTISVTGASDANFNTSLIVIVVTSPTQFTYIVANTGAGSATGASSRQLANLHQDVTHLSTCGKDTSTMPLYEIGLLGNQLARDGRDQFSNNIDAYGDIRYRGESLVTSNSVARRLAFRARGLITDTIGVVSPGGLTSIGTGDFAAVTTMEYNALEDNLLFFRLQKTNSTGNIGSLAVSRPSANAIRAVFRNDANAANVSRTLSSTGIDDNLGSIIQVGATRRSGKLTLYLNGVPIVVNGADSGTPTFAETLDSLFYRLSAGSDSSVNVFLESILWTSTISDAQMLSYFRTQVPPGTPALVWRFRDNGGNRITDESGNQQFGELLYNVSNNRNPIYQWAPRRGNGTIFSANQTIVLRVNEPQVLARSSGLQTCTLPTLRSDGSPIRIGDTMDLSGWGSGGWRIAQVAGTQIVEGAGLTVGTNATTVGVSGQLNSTQRYDAVMLRCVLSDTVTPSYVWAVLRKNGTLGFV